MQPVSSHIVSVDINSLCFCDESCDKFSGGEVPVLAGDKMDIESVEWLELRMMALNARPRDAHLVNYYLVSCKTVVFNLSIIATQF